MFKAELIHLAHTLTPGLVQSHLDKAFHCVKESVFGIVLVRIFPDFPAFGLNTELPVFGPNAGKSGKNAYQNKSEYGLFLRCACVPFAFVADQLVLH